MSKKYRVVNNDLYEDLGLKVGDIVTKVEASVNEDLIDAIIIAVKGANNDDMYELPKHLHGQGHFGYPHLKLKEPNYLYMDRDDLEEIKEDTK